MRTVEIGIASISDLVLSVSIDYHGDASPLVRKWHADRRVVDGICRDIEDAVADAMSEPEEPSAGDGTREIPGGLRSLGLALFQELLKDECDRLRDLSGGPPAAGDSDGSGGRTYLVFRIDKSVAYLPLELMHDGRDFLARRFAVGRVIYAESAEVRGPSRRRPPYTALIIGDPSRDARIGRDVEDEIDAVRDVFGRTRVYSPRIAVGDEADLKFILSNLPGSAIFHFSGHGVVSEDRERTGVKLASGEILSGYSLQGLQDAPVFAFLNACNPASRETWKGPLGIIETLLRRGARACVSSLWDVRSKTAVVLASHFYEHLLAGQTFGEALRQARTATAAEAGLHDPTWAAYVLYGDPRMRLVERPPHAPAAALRARRVSRRAAVFITVALAGLVLVAGLVFRGPAPEAPDTSAEYTGTSVVPPSEQQAEPAREVGYLVIESVPKDADIFIDGNYIGVTPYAAEVPVGMHEVMLEKQGYRRWEASVEVKVTPRTNVAPTLEKIR